MPRPRAVVAVALAMAVASALPLGGGGESARAEVGSATGPLSAVLDLTVTDLTAGRTVFAGKLAALHTAALGNFAQGDSHRYRFAVSFPGGAPARDNKLQVASTTVSYVWSAGPVTPASPAASTQPSTLGATAERPAPTALLTAAARQRGAKVRVVLTCQAACRARFSATARAGGAPARVPAATRTLRKPGRVVVPLAVPRRTRAALAAGRRATVSVSVRVTIDGRDLVLRKTVRLSGKRR
jgi:hypothetical protein